MTSFTKNLKPKKFFSLQTRSRDGHLGIPNLGCGSWSIHIQNANLNQVIGFCLDLPQHQQCTWYHHMKVNVHKQTFFQPIPVCFSLELHDNKSSSAHAQTFFQSIHVRFALHHMETTLSKYAHTDIFSVHSLCLSYTTWVSGNLALLCIHWHFAVHHIGFFETWYTQWFLKLLNWLHSFVSHWEHCFLHVLTSLVVVLLTCRLEECLERGKLQMSSDLCLHKWLGKIFV